MLIYTLDEHYQPDQILESFESFIWTERYNQHGDFQIVMVDDTQSRELLKVDRLIGHSETDWAMFIESINPAKDANGRSIITAKGRSLTLILSRRVAGPEENLSDLVLSGPPGNVVTKLMKPFTEEGGRVSSDDIIPGMSIVNVSRNAGMTAFALTWNVLYDAVKKVCDSKNLGFKIVIGEKPKTLDFYVYQGIFRELVEFGDALDNLTDVQEIISTEDHYNVVYLRPKDSNTVAAVAMEDGNIHIRGLSRRVLYADASDIDPTKYTPAQLTEVLHQRGREILAAHKPVNAIDGSVSADSLYKYNVDYKLGDTVDVYGLNRGQITRNMIVEYIWAWDGEGLRGYPTYEVVDSDILDSLQ